MGILILRPYKASAPVGATLADLLIGSPTVFSSNIGTSNLFDNIRYFTVVSDSLTVGGQPSITNDIFYSDTSLSSQPGTTSDIFYGNMSLFGQWTYSV